MILARRESVQVRFFCWLRLLLGVLLCAVVGEAGAGSGSDHFRVRAEVQRAGQYVVVSGRVEGIAYDEAGHADVSVYSPEGELLWSGLASYERDPENEEQWTFQASIPGVQGREIRLRIVHHAGPGAHGFDRARMRTGADAAAE